MKLPPADCRGDLPIRLAYKLGWLAGMPPPPPSMPRPADWRLTEVGKLGLVNMAPLPIGLYDMVFCVCVDLSTGGYRVNFREAFRVIQRLVLNHVTQTGDDRYLLHSRCLVLSDYVDV